MNEKVKKKISAGKIIAVAIIVVVIAAIINPQLLFFLSPAQQRAVGAFWNTYFGSAMPKSTGGGFDWFRLAALAALIAACWAVVFVSEIFAVKLKLKSNHAETIKGLLCNCVKYAAVIFGIVFGLSVLGVNMVALLTSLGILGLIIGFGAQTLIEDVITGLFIIFEGQFRVGDIITIDNFRGTVSSIGIRTTQLMDSGGNIKIVNNSDIRSLTNLSKTDSYAVTEVGISYDASIPEAEKAIKKLLDELPKMYPNVFTTLPEYSGVQDLAASSVNLRVVAKVDESQIYSARRLLNRELKLCLDEAGIEIPFPQVVVHKGE